MHFTDVSNNNKNKSDLGEFLIGLGFLFLLLSQPFPSLLGRIKDDV